MKEIFVSNENVYLLAINYYGTPYDGSMYVLTKKMQEALLELGIPVPLNGILE